ncbi:MAG TPA: hypothetical protein VNZ52_16105 [Candidatus Thermoplasmatota archaeon]|nr:hypothetical protein [Candidatus Thermoplasmatota archaeon]
MRFLLRALLLAALLVAGVPTAAAQDPVGRQTAGVSLALGSLEQGAGDAWEGIVEVSVSYFVPAGLAAGTLEVDLTAEGGFAVVFPEATIKFPVAAAGAAPYRTETQLVSFTVLQPDGPSRKGLAPPTLVGCSRPGPLHESGCGRLDLPLFGAGYRPGEIDGALVGEGQGTGAGSSAEGSAPRTARDTPAPSVVGVLAVVAAAAWVGLRRLA